MQLFCFTFAGGTAAFFDKLEDTCGECIDFIKLEYPGHGSRRKEPLCNNFDEVTTDLYKEIRKNYVGGDYALMGYSMGSIAVIEMLRHIIEKEDMPCPEHVFLAAHEPKVEVELEKYKQEEIDNYVKQRTIMFGGVPDSLINNHSFWRMYLPLYKADYLMISRYNFEKLKFTTDIPATIFYSEEDTPRVIMGGWEKYFIESCEFVEYKGSHFFINTYCKEMSRVIMNRLGVGQ